MKNEDSILKLTSQKEDFSAWYQDVVAAADLAEHSPVRGCMIIKPQGYALWENIQKNLDQMIKDKEVDNVYFPLFIPESFLKKESEHIEGFAPELAVVTHAGGKKLEEPLIVRPTSETIIYDAFSRWIQSYRDLPLAINQWANIVRWELRTRLFLRTSEFLWQEGHTAHATAQEAETYAKMILNDVYKKFAEEFLAIPVYSGIKSEAEKFAGAKQTYCIEGLMKDGKSLQFGTSHDLADNFSKPFNVKYLDQNGKEQYTFLTSWGVSTRLIGGLIMAHGDDKGIIMPPKIASTQIVIVPIVTEENNDIKAKIDSIHEDLKNKFRVKIDQRKELRAGEKFYYWEKRGVPVRIEIGPRDLIENKCVLVRRDTGEKESVLISEITSKLALLLNDIQKNLFNTALEYRETTNQIINTWDEFVIGAEKGGYMFAFWCEDSDCEKNIKSKTSVTTRCLDFNAKTESGDNRCVHCQKPTNNKRWIFARAY